MNRFAIVRREKGLGEKYNRAPDFWKRVACKFTLMTFLDKGAGVSH